VKLVQVNNNSSIHIAQFSGQVVEQTAGSAYKSRPLESVMVLDWLSEPKYLPK
jgi:hypothetical protein